MKISVVTTTKSKTKNILRLTQSLNKIKKDIYEFIVVDAGTPDIYDIVIEDFKFPQIIDGIGSSRGEGKNIGVRKAKGDVIAFLDDDTEVGMTWIDELKKSMKNEDIVAGYSPNPIGPTMPRVPIFVDGQDLTWPTCNIAYKKKIFDKIGYFDKDLITGEDIDFNLRCVIDGYIIYYNPKMVAKHYHRTTFKGFAKQAFWNGYGRKQLNKKYPELKHEHKHGVGLKNIMRLGFGFLGYSLGGLLK